MRGRKKEMQIPSPLPFFSSTPPPQGDLRVKICALPRNSVKIETNETEEDLVGRREGGTFRDTGELFQMEGRTKERICPSLSRTPPSPLRLPFSMQRKVNRNVVCHFKYVVLTTWEHHKFKHLQCEGHTQKHGSGERAPLYHRRTLSI